MKVVVMVGVAGSGKSSWVREQIRNSEEGGMGNCSTTSHKHLSSDNIRMEIFGGLVQGRENNTKVFEVMRERLVGYAKNPGEVEVVYYDATNLSRRKRRALMTTIKGANSKVEVHIAYFVKPLETILKQNKERFNEQEVVPESIVIKMYSNQQVPRVGVDCDTFEVIGSAIVVPEIGESSDLAEFIGGINFSWKEEVRKVYTPHDCLPWHVESVDTHIEMAITRAKDVAPHLTRVALFHDLGKGVTKTFKTPGKASYTGHSNISASYLLNFLWSIRKGELTEADWREVEVVFQHMNAHDGMGAKNIRNNKLDEETLKYIETFAGIDTVAKIKG